jgi:hypothetical protein
LQAFPIGIVRVMDQLATYRPCPPPALGWTMMFINRPVIQTAMKIATGFGSFDPGGIDQDRQTATFPLPREDYDVTILGGGS